MTAREGSMTDRWMGVFRSIGCQPIGAVHYARARAHKHRSVALLLVGLILVGGPAILTAVAVVADESELIGFAFLAWIVGPVLGAGPLHTGFKRLRHLRGIHSDSEVEVFVGTTPAQEVRTIPGSAIDKTTGRLLGARLIAAGRTHRLVVHPETGLLLEVDGVTVQDFVGGDVSITARVPLPPAAFPAATARPLGNLEKHELKLLGRRLTRGTWGPMVGIASAATAVTCLVWSTTSGQGPETDAVVTILAVCGGLLLAALVDWRARRRLGAKVQRDGEAGLQHESDQWLLAESRICWEVHGRPGALRLAEGGLGSEADGRARPMMF